MLVRRALLALALLLAVATPASAHTDLVSAEPAADEVVEESPSQVLLRFSDEVVPAAGGVTVVGSDGLRVDDGEVTKPDDTTIAIGLRPDLPAGRYAVEWSVLAPDGDVQEGGHGFVVAGSTAVPPTSAVTTTTTEGSTSVSVSDPPEQEESVDATSAILILVGMAILVAVIIGVLLRRRRQVEGDGEDGAG